MSQSGTNCAVSEQALIESSFNADVLWTHEWFSSCMNTVTEDDSVSTLNARQVPQNDRRRSQRVLLAVAVRISGSNPNGVAFVEDTATVVINANGGLVLLKAAVRQGQLLKIKNLNTDEETSCLVSDTNAGSNEGREVGVEFVAVAPKFWRVSFPPLDWNSRSAEAKRYGEARPSGENPPPLRVKK